MKNKILLFLSIICFSLLCTKNSFASNDNYIAFPKANSKLLISSESINSDSVAAFSTAFSIIKNKKVNPNSIKKFIKAKNYQETTIIKQLASNSGLLYSTIPYTSNNTLLVDILKNLHDKKIILINASGSSPFSIKGNYIVIYSASSSGYFKLFAPKNNKQQAELYDFKTLISAIKSNVKIYTIGEKQNEQN